MSSGRRWRGSELLRLDVARREELGTTPHPGRLGVPFWVVKGTSPFFPGILLSRKPPQTLRKRLVFGSRWLRLLIQVVNPQPSTWAWWSLDQGDRAFSPRQMGGFSLASRKGPLAWLRATFARCSYECHRWNQSDRVPPKPRLIDLQFFQEWRKWV